MKQALVVFPLVLLTACVSTGKTSPLPAQPAPATQAVAAAPAAARETAPAAPESEVARWARSHGYVLTTVGQRHLWCKEEVTVGSRIAQRTCLTEADLTMLRKTNERNKELFLNSGNGCPNATCTKGN